MQYDNNKLRQMNDMLAEDVLKVLEGWDRSYSGSLNKECVAKIPHRLKGVYTIHGVVSETMYVGQSESCIRTRLESHLGGSSNSNLKKAVSSGENLIFFCKESPDPRYEEALEIKRLKSAGYLQGQRREHKPLLELID